MTRASVAKQFVLVGLFCVAVMSFAFCAGPAQAQVVQPQYVRPSNGAAIDVRALLTNGSGATTSVYTGVGTVLTSPVLDFSVFQSAIVAVKAQNNCTVRPVIGFFGGTSPSSINFDFALPAPNASYLYTVGDTVFYVVSPISSYIRIRVTQSDLPGGGGNPTCSITTLTVTPVPFLAPRVISNSGRTKVSALTASPADVIDNSGAAAPLARQTLTIQNQSVSPVFCGPRGDVSTSNYAFILSASTAKENGTGGSRLLDDWNGFLQCVVDAAAACLPNDCLVSAFAY
jgi:hypothetical protein